MTKTEFSRISARFQAAVVLASLLALANVHLAHAQPMIVSTVPPMLATGVSPSAAVVITFSEAMDTSATAATFYDASNPFGGPLNTVDSWNAAGTILTCTPNPAFPSNKQIVWTVDGQNPNGDGLGGNNGGVFTTGTGGGSGGSGSGTNRITTFTLGKVYSYDQSSAAAPVLNVDTPFGFGATTTLASNRTATSITLTLPTAAVSNLTQNFVAHEDYYLFDYSASSNTLESIFPQGTYTFTVNATASNQTVAVSLPAGMPQPNAPHVSNYQAAQSVNATQPFTITWDAFAGGGTADYISVAVSATTNVWQTPDYGAPGALDGTATSVTIPADKLTPNTTYDVSLGFYHGIWNSNTTYATGVYRASITDFSLHAVGPSIAPPSLTNPGWLNGLFGFDVEAGLGQTVTITTSTDCASPVGSWQVLLTTNSPSTKFRVNDPASSSKPAAFYNVR